MLQRSSQTPALTDTPSSYSTQQINIAQQCCTPSASSTRQLPSKSLSHDHERPLTNRSAYKLFPDPTGVKLAQRPSTPTLRTGNAAAIAHPRHLRKSLSLDGARESSMLSALSSAQQAQNFESSRHQILGKTTTSDVSGPHQTVAGRRSLDDLTNDNSAHAPERQRHSSRPLERRAQPAAAGAALEHISRVQQVERLLARNATDEGSSNRHVITSSRAQQVRVERTSGPPRSAQTAIPRPIGPSMLSSKRSASPLRLQSSPVSTPRDPAGLGISYGSNVTTPDIAMFPVPGQVPGTQLQSPSYPVPRPRSPHGHRTSRPNSPYANSLLQQSSPKYGTPTASPGHYEQSPSDETVESSLQSPRGLSAKRGVDHNLRVDTNVSKPNMPQLSAGRPPQPRPRLVQPANVELHKQTVRKSRLQKPLPATPPIDALVPPAPAADFSDTSNDSPQIDEPDEVPSPISPISPVSPIHHTNSTLLEPTIGSPVSAMTTDSRQAPQVPADAPSVPPIPKSISRKPVAKSNPQTPITRASITPPASRYQITNPSVESRPNLSGQVASNSPQSIVSQPQSNLSLSPGNTQHFEPSPSLSISPQPSNASVHVEEARTIAIQPLERKTEPGSNQLKPANQSSRPRQNRPAALDLIDRNDVTPVKPANSSRTNAVALEVPTMLNSSSGATLGVYRPRSSSGAKGLAADSQPKLTYIHIEVKAEDAPRTSQTGTTLTVDSATLLGGGERLSPSIYTPPRTPKSASPRRGHFQGGASSRPHSPRTDSLPNLASPIRTEFEAKKDIPAPATSLAVPPTDYISPRPASEDKIDVAATTATTNSTHVEPVRPTDVQPPTAMAHQDEQQPPASPRQRPSLEAKSISLPQVDKALNSEIVAALMPKKPVRSNTLPQDQLLPKGDTPLSQPENGKVPSYKSFFMQADASETAPIEFPTPRSSTSTPRPSTSSDTITKDFALNKRPDMVRAFPGGQATQERQFSASLRSVKTMPSLTETVSEHKSPDKAASPLTTTPTSAPSRLSENRNPPPRADSEEKRFTPQFTQNTRRHSPGLTGNPFTPEDLAQSPQRPRTSSSTETKESVQEQVKYTAYNKSARDSPMRNSPLSAMNRMDSMRDIPAELSRPGTGEAPSSTDIVASELNLPASKTGVDHAQVLVDRKLVDTLQAARPRAAAALNERNPAQPEQRPNTAGSDRKERRPAGPSLSLMPPIQATRTITPTPREPLARQTARPDSQVPPPVPRKDTIKQGIKRILNPKATAAATAARTDSMSSIQTDPSITETNNADKTTVTETASSHTSMASTTTKPESIAASNIETSSTNEKPVEPTSIEAIRARIAGLSAKTSKPAEQDEATIISTLEDLAKQSEAMHERYAGLRAERQKLSSSITTHLKENKAGPEYTNTLLDKHMALSAITSSLDICFAKLKSLDYRKEEAIAALIKHVNDKGASPTATRPKTPKATSKSTVPNVATPSRTVKDRTSVKPATTSNEQKTLIASNSTQAKTDDATKDVSSSAKVERYVTRENGPAPPMDNIYQSPKARVGTSTIVAKKDATDTTDDGYEKVITLPNRSGAADNNSRLVVTIGSTGRQAKTPPPQRPLPTAPAKGKSPVDSIHAATLQEGAKPNAMKDSRAGRNARAYAEDDFLDYYRSAPD